MSVPAQTRERRAGLVAAGQGQALLEVSYLGGLVEGTARWRRLCGRRVTQGGLGHDCAPTLAQRVCGSGDADQQCPTKRGIRSRSGPAQESCTESVEWEWEEIIKGGRGEKDEGGRVAGEDGNSCDWVADSATRDTARK